MDEIIQIPEKAPIMALPNAVLFPQALLPLHIFEPRYRSMLETVLESDRLLIITQKIDSVDDIDTDEPSERIAEIASIGVVRASHKNPEGTSNLILQGISRVRFKNILQEEPYQVAEIEPLESVPGASEEVLQEQKNNLLKTLEIHYKLGGNITEEVLTFLVSVEDPNTLLDLAIFTLCQEPSEKQSLLETLDTHERYKRYTQFVRSENEMLVIEKRLKRGLSDDQISQN